MVQFPRMVKATGWGNVLVTIQCAGVTQTTAILKPAEDVIPLASMSTIISLSNIAS